ncbi:ATP-dependent zinc metalloprotease YME1L1-like isoform X2 [Antennarius striatus]|uniref:ATP-dependent zinc metalloprotease YME1L1-like isoform X2 n=1 Tax=Antennarius striatus TaxID=241820 RepID=UPI0035B08BE5
MFSLPLQPQVTLPLSHFINILRSMKNLGSSSTSSPSSSSSSSPSSSSSSSSSSSPSSSSSSSPWRNQEVASDGFLTHMETWTLRELRFLDLEALPLDELLLPHWSPQEAGLLPGDPGTWRTSYVSSHSFLYNKNGFLWGPTPMPTPFLSRQHPSPLQNLSTQLQLWPGLLQTRGFKTLRRTRRQQGAPARALEPDGVVPSFIKGFLSRDRPLDVESLESLLKQKNVPEGHQDAFKWGFTEGFLKAQVLAQRTQDSLRRTRLILLLLLLVGLYGLFKLPFLSGLNVALDPVQIKNVTFEHVKGAEEAKSELQDVVEFLKNPQKFTALGGKLPKGVLLVGPPGTGKTLLARAVAGEADVPFYYASGSEFDEMFVGVGAGRIRNLFREAKANTPCVIFIDELDSVGGKRIESPMHPYSRQTINQLLAEMDGFKPNEGVIVIGATNFPESLDHALIRPGRFDMQVTVPKPDVKGRTEILDWYLKKIKVDPAIEANLIARGTVGFSGADLENLVNQAALKAAVDNKGMVTMKELEFAKDKILMGPERRSAEIDQKNKLITAYHESGHAIVAFYTKDAMPINKATIMPRGPSLGHVSLLPENDRWSETRSQLLAQMDVSMGGRVAEELMFGPENITTGASNDFDSATKIAKMMVTRYGMCEKLGVMTYSDMASQSPETQAAVEQEVRLLLKASYERARALLKARAREHKNLADALLTYETLDAKEIRLVLEGGALDAR